MNLKLFFVSIISGVLSGLSFNHPCFSFLIWFTLSPFFFVLEKSKKTRLLIYAFGAGFAYFFTVIFWVGYVTKLGLIILVFYLSLYWVVFAYLAKFFLRRSFKFLTIPSLWILLEFSREMIWPRFGWAILGYSQYKNVFLIQGADILGVKFISWLIILTNITIYDILKKKIAGRNYREGGLLPKAGPWQIISKETILFATLLSVSFLYSFYRVNTGEISGKIKLSLVQTNISQDLKWESSYIPVILEKLKRLGKLAPESALIIYPEASYPFILQKSNLAELQNLFDGINKTALIGAVEKANGKFYNAAIMLNQEGEILAKYRKLKLVPFGEYIPLRNFVKFIKVINTMGDISPGNNKEVFSLNGKKFSVLICFEDLFAFMARDFARGSDFIVNITNDAWFHGEPEASQHLAVLVFRAIENRIPIVRAANTGITGWVSSTGDIKKFSRKGKEIFTEGVFAADINLDKEVSFYSRHPELIVLFAVIAVFMPIFGRYNDN
ncbi:MAG: apolipoprotein N-acyltransferase [Candidatus Omnitrophica bacterium]|nr:apolipoprotein N-acyltransferase [Candidatus Omnitrophota bacterium]